MSILYSVLHRLHDKPLVQQLCLQYAHTHSSSYTNNFPSHNTSRPQKRPCTKIPRIERNRDATSRHLYWQRWKVIKPSTKLKGLFWTKLKNDCIKDTVWYKLPEHSLSRKDVSLLEEWFSAKGPAESAVVKKETKVDDAPPKLISILDGKRTQSVLILLGKLRVQPEDVAQRVRDMDPAVLDQELTAALLEVVPTAEEMTAVKAYSDPLVLDRASRLVFHLNQLPRLSARLECHLQGFTWPVNAAASCSQVDAIHKAVRELQQDQSKISRILSLVLAVGNYINGDTPRGQAYGIRLDIFAKMVNLKAVLPSQGSLMNYLASLAEESAPDTLNLSEQWMGVWAAAEVNFKQLTTDVNQLDVQLQRVQQEATKAKDLPGERPLVQRLDHIVQTNQPVMNNLKSSLRQAESSLETLLSRYGESLKAPSEEDPAKKFFSTFAEFAKSFRAAVDENASKRQEADKAQRMAAEIDAKAAAVDDGAGKDKAGKAVRKGPQENLFGRFHDAQKASAGDVLAEFKLRMANKGK